MEYNKSYAREMRIGRRLAQWTEKHHGIINTSLIIQAAAMLYYVFMYG